MNMDLAYIISVGACCLAAVFTWFSFSKWIHAVLWTFVFVSLTALVVKLGTLGHHLPIFGETLEAPLAVAWTLCLAGIVAQFLFKREREAPFMMLGVLLCVAFTLHQSIEPHPDAFWYAHWTATMFFLFRVVSIAGTLFSGSFYAAAIFDQKASAERTERIWMGRNFLIASIILFGISELSGSIWAMKGWGEFWVFNPGFLSSAGSFLILLIPFHLSNRWTKNPQTRPTIAVLCSVVFMQLVLLRMH
jgi:hypothetical protein